MKILFVHGIGRSDNDPNYYVPWKTAVTQGLKSAGFVGEPQYVEFHYDDLFYDQTPQIVAPSKVMSAVVPGRPTRIKSKPKK
jgi:hypothetical protein